ncbi:MAG: NAD(P)-binding domain-containing protein [Pseudomonadota bacterium]
MRIGIVGAGAVGSSLARLCIQHGHQVSIANSRGPKSLMALAAEIGAAAVDIADAVTAADVVVIAIPTKAIPLLPKAFFAQLSERVAVIDTCNYHPELRDGRIDAIDNGEVESHWVAKQIGHPVVKAFNNILATNLVQKATAKGAQGRIALSAAGDSSETKAIVFHLIDALGFDPVDAGSLENSWRQQTGTPSYCTDLDAESLKRALASADRSLIAQYRADREASLRRMMAAKP